MEDYVFISHSSENQAIATHIVEYLADCGIASWISYRDIPAGTDYPTQIIDAIENCSCFLLLLSKQAQKSSHVMTELGRAFGKNKAIFPLQLEKFDFDEKLQYYMEFVQAKPIFPRPLADYKASITTEVRAILDGDQEILRKYKRPGTPVLKITLAAAAVLIVVMLVGWSVYVKRFSQEALEQLEYRQIESKLVVDIEHNNWSGVIDHLDRLNDCAQKSDNPELYDSMVTQLKTAFDSIPPDLTVTREAYDKLRKLPAGHKTLEALISRYDFQLTMNQAEALADKQSWQNALANLIDAGRIAEACGSTKLDAQYTAAAAAMIERMSQSITPDTIHLVAPCRSSIQKIGRDNIPGCSGLEQKIDYYTGCQQLQAAVAENDWDSVIRHTYRLRALAAAIPAPDPRYAHKRLAANALHTCITAGRDRLENLAQTYGDELLDMAQNDRLSQAALLLLKATVDYDYKKDQIVSKDQKRLLNELIIKNDADYDTYFDSDEYQGFLNIVLELSRIVSDDPSVAKDDRALAYMYQGDILYRAPSDLAPAEKDYNRQVYDLYMESAKLGNNDGLGRAVMIRLFEAVHADRGALPNWLTSDYADAVTCRNCASDDLIKAYADGFTRYKTRYVFAMSIFGRVRDAGMDISLVGHDTARKAYDEILLLARENWQAAVAYVKDEGSQTFLDELKQKIYQ